MKKKWKKLVPLLLAIIIVAVLVAMFIPGPIPVDTAVISRGPLQVTVSEDGRTRVRDRYIVSAPLAGRLQRIRLRAGDEVKAGETLVAAIEPVDPSLLDPRALAEARLRVQAAEARLRRAEPELTRAAAEVEFAQQQLRLRREAAVLNAISQQALEEAILLERTRVAELRAAELGLEVARYELELAEAALLRTQGGASQAQGAFEVRAPVNGRVLRVIEESATVVQPGMPLLEIGDPADLEAVVDVLSRDAVQIRPGARVAFEHWGGPRPLEGRVRLVEPSGFTKVSALGVEEQRVNVVIDFDDLEENGERLGDGFRVEARIAVWETADAVLAPIGALFRIGGEWAVYEVAGHRITPRTIRVGQRTDSYAEVLDGIGEGGVVVLYPSDRLQPGSRIAPR